MQLEDYNNKKNELETAKAEAEIAFDGEKIGEIEKQLAQLEVDKTTFETTAQQAETVPEAQVAQIQELGGNPEAVPGVAEIASEAQQVEADAESKIAEKISTNPEEKKFNYENLKNEAVEALQKLASSGEIEQSSEFRDATENPSDFSKLRKLTDMVEDKIFQITDSVCRKIESERGPHDASVFYEKAASKNWNSLGVDFPSVRELKDNYYKLKNNQ